jgi:hypothetical protein
MITGERAIKKASWTVTGSRRSNISRWTWLVGIARKHKQHNQDRRYIIQKSKGKTSTTLQYPTITRKNKHNQDTRNSQPTQLTPTLQYPAQPVAGGYRMQGALWAPRCIVGAWVFRDKKVAHILERHACRWVETRRTHSAVYPIKIIYSPNIFYQNWTVRQLMSTLQQRVAFIDRSCRV